MHPGEDPLRNRHLGGGFAEAGRRDLQQRIVAIAQEASFPFVGPNCLGIYVPLMWTPSSCRANAW